MSDRETGLSIRFVREFDPDRDRFSSTMDATMYPHQHLSMFGYCWFCGLRMSPLASQPQTVQNGAVTHE